MNTRPTERHSCHRCVPHDVQAPFRQQGHPDAPALDTLETTAADNGDEVFFTSGYGAREIAEKHAREKGANVYVNSVSRNVKRRDLSVHVAYAVSKSPVYTLRGPDQWHEK